MTFTRGSQPRRESMQHPTRPLRHGRGRAHGAIASGPGVQLLCVVGLGLACSFSSPAALPSFDLEIEQVTSGTKHHLFGYIGQCRTIPWNASGRYILGMEIDRIDRMPQPREAATVILVDTHQNNRILRLDSTYAWNPQQGTMFYWNPLSPETQFFFNDRDVESGKVFTVLYDVEKRQRIREYRYEDTPIGNGGVAADGSAWLGLNYGRLARLRPVTGYPGALDWSEEDLAPENDGIFKVYTNSGDKHLLVSYRQLEAKLKQHDPGMQHTGLFINHTLWNRDGTRIYFFVRSGWDGRGGQRINVPCSIHADGTGLTVQDFIGGHPEWAEGSLMIGRQGNRQVLYDVDQKQVVRQLGTPEIFPDPEGDIALSPDGNWFVNGYKVHSEDGNRNVYTVFRRSDGAHARSEGLDKGSYSGTIRIDPAPRWNRTNSAVLVPGIADNKTRQLFLIRIRSPEASSLTVSNGSRSGRHLLGAVISIHASAAPPGQVFSQWVGGNGYIEDVYAPDTTMIMPGCDVSISATYRGTTSCGIEDIDALREEVKGDPGTSSRNVAGRRAALYRWWRLLWHQGHDMTAFDEAADQLVYRDNTNAWAVNAVAPGYAALEHIQTNGTHIQEVPGTPESPTTRTDWPVYHGTTGHQAGFSPDTGPSQGKLAWRYPVGHHWYATPVIRNGRVYAAGAGADVVGYCLDEATGEVVWKARQHGLDFYRTTGTKWAPVVSSDRVMLWTGWFEPRDALILSRSTGDRVASMPAGDTDGGDPAEPAVYRKNRTHVILADARTGQGIWQYRTGGLLAGDPVLHGDKVYAARLAGQVHQLSAANGSPAWTCTIDAGLRGKPSIGRGRVFVGDTERRLHALDDTSGRILWSYQAGEVENKAYQFFSGAVEANGRVYVGAASRYVYCLDVSTGRLIWKHELGDWVRSRPVVLGKTVYVATLDSRIHALRDDGDAASLWWQRKVGEHGFTADLVGNSRGILASGQDVVLYSLSPETGYVQWRRGLLEQVWKDGRPHAAEVIGGQYMSSPTIVDGIAYVGGPDGFARALNADTGELLWRYETSGQIKAALTVGGGMVFIPQTAGDNDFHAVNSRSGEPVWTTDQFGWVFPGVGYAPACHEDSDPANDRARVYVAARSGKVYGVKAGNGDVDWTSTASLGCDGLFPHPATDASKFYTGGHDGFYRAWNQGNGHVEWSVQTGSGSGGDPDSAGMVMWKDRLYVQKLGRTIAALNAADGTVDWEWTAPAGCLQNGTVAAFDGMIFGSAIRGAVELPYRSVIYAFNDVDHGGNQLWSYRAGGGGGGLTGPVGAPGKLIFGSTAGVFMTCLDPGTGRLKWRCYIGGAMEEAVPAIYGDKVFFLSRDGYFNAVE